MYYYYCLVSPPYFSQWLTEFSTRKNRILTFFLWLNVGLSNRFSVFLEKKKNLLYNRLFFRLLHFILEICCGYKLIKLLFNNCIGKKRLGKQFLTSNKRLLMIQFDQNILSSGMLKETRIKWMGKNYISDINTMKSYLQSICMTLKDIFENRRWLENIPESIAEEKARSNWLNQKIVIGSPVSWWKVSYIKIMH